MFIKQGKQPGKNLVTNSTQSMRQINQYEVEVFFNSDKEQTIKT